MIHLNQVIYSRAAGGNDIIHLTFSYELQVSICHCSSPLGCFKNICEAKLPQSRTDLPDLLKIQQAEIGRSKLHRYPLTASDHRFYLPELARHRLCLLRADSQAVAA